MFETNPIYFKILIGVCFIIFFSNTLIFNFQKSRFWLVFVSLYKSVQDPEIGKFSVGSLDLQAICVIVLIRTQYMFQKQRWNKKLQHHNHMFYILVQACLTGKQFKFGVNQKTIVFVLCFSL